MGVVVVNVVAEGEAAASRGIVAALGGRRFGPFARPLVIWQKVSFFYPVHYKT